MRNTAKMKTEGVVDESDKPTGVSSQKTVKRPPLQAPLIMKKDGGEHFVVTSNVIAPDEYKYDWTSVTNIKVWQFLLVGRKRGHMLH